MCRPGGEKRGNNRDRKQRKLWLLGAIEDRVLGLAPFDGDGQKVPCVHCGKALTYRTVEADRIIPGGSYKRSNVQPACRRCNLRRGDSPNPRLERHEAVAG